MKKSKYFSIGLMIFLVIAVSAALVFVLFNFKDVLSVVKEFFDIISSVVIGALFAYLLNPVVKAVEKLMLKMLAKSNMPERTAKKFSRIVGVIIAMILLIGTIAVLIAAIVPGLIRSISEILAQERLQSYYDSFVAWGEGVVRGTAFENWFVDNVKNGDLFDKISELAKKVDITTISSVLSGAYSVLKFVANALIGIIVALYMLLSKDKFQAQAKKIVVACFRPKRANRVLELSRRTNSILGGFFVGKIIDSLIIGILCYIGMRIFGMSQPELISVVFAITNIIPFFGPFIGIAFGTLLLLLEGLVSGNAFPALYFLIFSFILQQIDGNIIGPRILGDRLGISDFWVLVSITVFGGIFGFGGMLLGVPVFTLIYSLIDDAVNNSLKKKKLTTKTDAYYNIITVSDLDAYDETFSHSTVVYSEDTFESEYDPDTDMEIDDDPNADNDVLD